MRRYELLVDGIEPNGLLKETVGQVVQTDEGLRV
jgi:hypothetical protein